MTEDRVYSRHVRMPSLFLNKSRIESCFHLLVNKQDSLPVHSGIIEDAGCYWCVCAPGLQGPGAKFSTRLGTKTRHPVPTIWTMTPKWRDWPVSTAEENLSITRSAQFLNSFKGALVYFKKCFLSHLPSWVNRLLFINGTDIKMKRVYYSVMAMVT